MSGEIKRVSFTELEVYAKQLAERGDKSAANDAMVLQHLIASLRANAERDLLMAQMAARFDALEKERDSTRALHSAAYQALVTEFRALQRQQDELRAQQAVIAAVVDAGIEKISSVVNKIENLTEVIKDFSEP